MAYKLYVVHGNPERSRHAFFRGDPQNLEELYGLRDDLQKWSLETCSMSERRYGIGPLDDAERKEIEDAMAHCQTA